MNKIKTFFKGWSSLFKTNLGHMIFTILATFFLTGIIMAPAEPAPAPDAEGASKTVVNATDDAVSNSEAQPTEPTTTTAATTTAKQIMRYEADMYKIGADMPAGVYVLYPSSTGYFCISSDSNQDNIVENDNFNGKVYIQVADGQYLDINRAYAIAAADDTPTKTPATLGDGMYKAGVDIPAGEYKLSANDGAGYWCIYNQPLGVGDIVSNELFESSSYVTVKEGQYLYVKRATFMVG